MEKELVTDSPHWGEWRGNKANFRKPGKKNK